jgi:hypothetical protein
MKKSWNKIKRMIAEGYVHRKGFNLKDVKPRFILQQAEEEFNELKAEPDNPEEMADLLGVLIHYSIKQGWTMEVLENYLMEKLDLRFMKGGE